MARTAAATSAPSAPGLLQAALLLLLLVAACRPDAAAPEDAAGAPENGTEGPLLPELGCQCLQTVLEIDAKNIQSVKLTNPGPHCNQTEVIVTDKDGKKVCLKPEFSLVNMVLEELLKMATTNTTMVYVEPPALVSVSVESE